MFPWMSQQQQESLLVRRQDSDDLSSFGSIELMSPQHWHLELHVVSILLLSITLAALGLVIMNNLEHQYKNKYGSYETNNNNNNNNNTSLEASASDDPQQERKEFIAKLISTKKVPRKSATANATGCCCPICLEEFQDGEIISQSPNCCHCFHLEGCMNEWLLRHDNCPCCRTQYLPRNTSNKNLRYVPPVTRSDAFMESSSSASSESVTSSSSLIAPMITTTTTTTTTTMVPSSPSSSSSSEASVLSATSLLVHHRTNNYDSEEEYHNNPDHFVTAMEDLPPWLGLTSNTILTTGGSISP